MLGDKQKRFRIRFARDTEPSSFETWRKCNVKGGGAVNSGGCAGLAGAVQSVFPGRARGNALPAGDFLSDARHFAETGDAVVDVGVGAEQLGHAAAEEGGDDEHFRRGGVAVLHGDALVP